MENYVVFRIISPTLCFRNLKEKLKNVVDVYHITFGDYLLEYENVETDFNITFEDMRMFPPEGTLLLKIISKIIECCACVLH
jgi:hypothetical protein